MTLELTKQPITLPQEWQQLSNWLLLSFIPGLGAVRYRALLKQFGSPEGILAASYQQLKAGLPDKLAQQIASNPETPEINDRLTYTRNWLESSEAHHIICFASPDYPARLKEVSDAPPLLYVVGNHRLLSEPQLAIVGSRRPTPQGRRLAHDFALELGKSGLVITSGMALGIDAAAHQGVLSSYGSTVAVLGTGVDQIYPRNHRSLYSLIAQQGALISEFPLGTSANPGHFPKRNRIISGLSLGVLVVEAEQKSGSLISARLAAEQGREVFAVPGSVLNPLTKGCHQLLREGAILVETHEDVLVELQTQLEPMLAETEPEQEIVSDAINSQHLNVLDCMGFDVASMDLLSQVCGLPCEELSVVLTELEMEGLVQSVPGGFLRTR